MSPERFSEDELVERPAIALLAQLGWATVDAREEMLGPGGTLGRSSRRNAILEHRLFQALRGLNPNAPGAALEEASAALARDRSLLEPTRASREVYDLLRNGYLAAWRDDHGDEQTARIAYVDWRDPSRNDWLAAHQMWIAGDLHTRRVDLVLFVNGIPLVLAEFKEPGRSVRAAYDENLNDYRDTIPQLFWPNAFVMLSNGSATRLGATFAPWEQFGEWKAIDAEGTRGRVELETAIRGACAPARLLDLVESFVAYSEQPGGLVKSLARYHQYFGVNAALEALDRVRATGDKQLGVFWHTQGAGKSLSMFWYTQKVLRLIPGGWTFVMVTDRKELDDQLHDTFVDAGAISREADVHAETAAHLRDLLRADHRYVFTLIHKFRLREGEAEMPVLSDRDDVIVITDEAHRTQYDILAQNMRSSLPEAAFMGFTGTPLVAGEELTRQEFGDYVSIYNFRDAIADGATVPLFYENRIPELQLVNEAFDEELNEILEEAEVDDEAEALLVRRFAREVALIRRPERLRTIARDLVRHFVGRGFDGKAMVVSIDKVTAVRMHDLVREEWEAYLTELRDEHDALPELERAWHASRIELMETTDMAVVVSQGQNEVAELERAGLDIRPHRARMVAEQLEERFKDPRDPLRLVFVVAMWMTGFDAPSCSTVYLDRPMRNHTLMQTIARANRVFPEKENGLIVDYIGVFRDLEKALAIYGAATDDDRIGSPIQDKAALVRALEGSVDACSDLCARYDVDLDELRAATGFEFIALRDAAVEALLVDEEVREAFLGSARRARKLFKAVLPDPVAAGQQGTVAVIRVLAERLLDLGRGERPDISEVSDAVDALLDRSVGAEEYVIRAAAEGVDPDPLIDLAQIDFDALAARFAGRKRSETERLASLLRDRVVGAARKNPTRHELVDRIELLIAEYNAGSLNIDEYLRRLIALSKDLSDEEVRAATEDLSEEELAVFDLLTKPEPVLTDDEREQVKGVAKRLLEHVHEKLVLDWRRRAETTADMRVTIRNVLDELPTDPYPRTVYDDKVQAVFDHVSTVYGDDGSSVYEEAAPIAAAEAPSPSVPIDEITDSLVRRIRSDAQFAELVAEQLRGRTPTFARSIDELIANDEDDAVEFKSTARWDLREGRRNPALEDAIVKTVAAFLNCEGGTLLIGVGPDGSLLGLELDYAQVKPQNGDGFVNWLTTHLANSVGAAAMMRTRARVVNHAGFEICRLDVASSSRPVWAKTSKDDRVFFVRMNNSSRPMPPTELDAYLADRWPREGALTEA
ncbi:MAG TPA: HsdR family type I site-specific deoxyribonuclease [Gaiellaceae bacterium]